MTASRGAPAAPKPLLTTTEPKDTRGGKKDDRPAWQQLKDLQAEEELERRRHRTDAELAEIERKRAWVEELDRRETERRDRELEESARAH